MADPLGLIGSGGSAYRPVQGLGNTAGGSVPQTGAQAGGPSFKDVLLQNLQKVNELQQGASKAVEDVMTGKRDDVETVLMATQQADQAFRMLQAVRNKVMEAYDEIKQIRV